MRLNKFFYRVVLLYCFSVLSLTGYAQHEISLKKQLSTQKLINSLFAKGQKPPFSFVYGDVNSSNFINKWKFTKRAVKCDQPNTLKYEVFYTEPSGAMEVRCDVTGYTDFEAVEWVLHFTNKGNANSKNIKNISASDVCFAAKGNEAFTIFTARGSNGTRNDFSPVVIEAATDTLYAFSPVRGRSSDTSAFPFFNIVAGGSKGVMLSVGWTGTWFADFSLTKGKLTSHSGMKNTNLFLYPGESIRTPLVSLMFWEGDDRLDGQNVFRRFILAHHTRQINGKNADAPLCGGFEWGDPAPCNEYGCLTEDMAIAMAKRYKQFGIMPDVFWLDAGWYEGAGGPNFEGKTWYNTVGNWSVDRKRFPDGFKKLSKVIHDMGAKFMVWFEPERVYKGSYLHKTYPQWVLTSPNSDNYLFDLGNKEACDFMCKYIGDFIEENGIDYYRQDFNMGLNGYWDAKDKKDGRKGMSEIRHVEGLYRFWDYLLARFPEMQIDNCASGGRRIDLETTSRSIPLWRTDYSYGEPTGYQNQTYNLSMFIPLNGTGVYSTVPYHWRSSVSSAMVINWENSARSGNVKEMQALVAKYRTIKKYFLEDYYPLSGDGDLTGDEHCLAYQLNKPDDATGYLFAFRRGVAAPGKLTVKLRALSPEKNYKLIDDDNGAEIVKSGKALMEGFEISFDKAPCSKLFIYEAE